jgi:WD40 repeat protein
MSGFREKRIIRNTTIVSSVSFTNDGTEIIAGNYDNTVKIWNADTSSIITQLNYITDEENLSINIKLSDLSFGFGFEDDLPASVGNFKLSYVNSIAGANSTDVVIGT